MYKTRIPYEFFITTGKGESRRGSAGLPYETGSYDAALTDAGIENANMIFYTSVLPPQAVQITKEEGIKRLRWGEVLESITSQMNGSHGAFISVALLTTSVTDKYGKYLGGFACEYAGHGTQQEAEESLRESIESMIIRRGYGKVTLKLYKDNVTDKGMIIHPGKIMVYESMKVNDPHGTVIACMCFVSYLKESQKLTRKIK